MPQLSSGTARCLLAAAAGTPASSADSDALADARRWPNKFTPTLLSVWRREGRELAPDERRELEKHERRATSYRALLQELAAVAPVAATKGLRIAAAYPEGILRQVNDLDLMTPRPPQVWTLARHLAERGWEPTRLTVVARDGTLHPYLIVERPGGGPGLSEDRVELSSAAFPGNLRDVPLVPWSDLADDAPVVADLLLVELRMSERPVGARDVLDFAVLAEQADERAVRDVLALTDRYRLWGELAALAERAVACGLLPPDSPAAVPPGRGRIWRARALRKATGARRLGRPTLAVLAYVQRELTEESAGRAVGVLSRVVARRADAARVLRAGLPLFGLRIDAEPGPSATMELEPRTHAVLARTPVGTFALVAGDYVAEEWLD